MKPSCLSLLPLLLALPALASVFPAHIQLERQTVDKPRNVVFILTDDHRYDAMGFMGHPFIQTPHLDAIAANGVHLANAVVTTSLCSPSRASILTGLYTHKHRVIDNNRSEPEGIVYFPQYLQQAGYHTAFIGKWHMGDEGDHPRPGFDHWISFKGQGTYLPPAQLNINGQHVPQKGYITDELTDYAIEWLQQQQDSSKPFFLYLSHKAAHADFTPAERHLNRYRDNSWTPPDSPDPRSKDFRQLPRWLRDQRNSWHGVDYPYHSTVDIEQYYKRYCETLLAVDESVGRLKQQLRDMGVYEETLIIYMGDNGFMFGEHGLIDKRVAYETSIRVPLLMQCPELFQGPVNVDEVVANFDLAPTILDAAGIRKPPHMDGQSFLPLAQQHDTPWRQYFLYVYYWEKNYPQTPTVFSLRSQRYKYITYYGLWDTDELYDLLQDPAESRNLIAEPFLQPVVQKMEKHLYDLLAEADALHIPLNRPNGWSSNKRYSPRQGWNAADFPASMIDNSPANNKAH